MVGGHYKRNAGQYRSRVSWFFWKDACDSRLITVAAKLVPIERGRAAHAEGSAGVETAVEKNSFHVDGNHARAIGLFAVQLHLNIAGRGNVAVLNHGHIAFGPHLPLASDFAATNGSLAAAAARRVFRGPAVANWAGVLPIVRAGGCMCRSRRVRDGLGGRVRRGWVRRHRFLGSWRGGSWRGGICWGRLRLARCG